MRKVDLNIKLIWPLLVSLNAVYHLVLKMFYFNELFQKFKASLVNIKGCVHPLIYVLSPLVVSLIKKEKTLRFLQIKSCNNTQQTMFQRVHHKCEKSVNCELVALMY